MPIYAGIVFDMTVVLYAKLQFRLTLYVEFISALNC